MHDEATRGRDRRVLVPLSLDGSEPPLGFRQFQTIDISKARLKRGEPVADAVIRAVTALHDRAPVPMRPRAAVAARGLTGGCCLAVARAACGWRRRCVVVGPVQP